MFELASSLMPQLFGNEYNKGLVQVLKNFFTFENILDLFLDRFTNY